MSKDYILDIQKLKMYFKFARQTSTNFFDSSTTRTFGFSPADYFAENTIKDKITEDLETIRKNSIKNETNLTDLARVLDGVNLRIEKGKNISIVGESGAGKSTLLLSIFNFPNAEIQYQAGKILYHQEEKEIDLLQLKENEMRKLRGLHFSFVPQLAKQSINPWIKLGLQTGEILTHRLSQKQETVKEKVIEHLGIVAFPDPTINVNKYVHQLSGGQAQKLVIAMALIANPKLVIADEILSSLDTISQGQVIDLIKDLHKKLNIQYLFSTHNITAALNMSEEIAVMYAGEIVEITSTEKFLHEPLHPYTIGLLESIPWYATQKGIELKGIDGEPPSLYDWTGGCRFASRCPNVMAKCLKQKPDLVTYNDQQVSCWLY